jgi:hypothetical protein
MATSVKQVFKGYSFYLPHRAAEVTNSEGSLETKQQYPHGYLTVAAHMVNEGLK